MSQKKVRAALVVLVGVVTFTALSCRKIPPSGDSTSDARDKSKGTMMQAEQGQKPVGNATMTDDGAIILDLRAEGPRGEIGMSRFVYPPSHPQYQKILTHLGGLKPGEQKVVPPFPDK